MPRRLDVRHLEDSLTHLDDIDLKIASPSDIMIFIGVNIPKALLTSDIRIGRKGKLWQFSQGLDGQCLALPSTCSMSSMSNRMNSAYKNTNGKEHQMNWGK